MVILVTAGVMLVMAVGLAIVTDARDRKARRGRVQRRQIDAGKANVLTVVEPFNPSGGGVYLPPPDDGRPQH